MSLGYYVIIKKYGRNSSDCDRFVVARDHPDPVDDYSTLLGILNPWILGDDSKTANNWSFDLARNEYWLPFPPDVVGIFYIVVVVDTRDYWINGDGDTNCGVSGGGIHFVGGTKIV